MGGGRGYINTGPRLSADTGLGACVDVEKARVWMCLRRRRRGAAEEVDPVRDRPEGAGVVVDGKRTGKQLAQRPPTAVLGVTRHEAVHVPS